MELKSRDCTMETCPKNNPGFPVAELTKENIESTINNKEEKLSLYQQKKISECWLIIATDYILLPKGENISGLISDLEIHSRYQKIFLMDLFDNKVIALTLK